MKNSVSDDFDVTDITKTQNMLNYFQQNSKNLQDLSKKIVSDSKINNKTIESGIKEMMKTYGLNSLTPLKKIDELQIAASSLIKKHITDVKKNIDDANSSILDLEKQKRSSTDPREKFDISKEIENTRNSVKNYEEEIENSNGKLKSQEQIWGAIKNKSGGMERIAGGVLKQMKGMGGAIGDVANIIELATEGIEAMGGSLIVFLGLLTLSFERFGELDSAGEKFRKETGVTRSQFSDLEKTLRNVQLNTADLSASMEDVTNSAVVLSKEFNNSSLAIKDNLEFTTALNKIFGVAEGDTAKILSNYVGMNHASMQEAQYSIIRTKELIKSLGGAANLSTVMKDVASASDETLQAFRANPKALQDASIYARTLGTSLESVSRSIHQSLNWEDSLNKEMELGVLLGKQINLQGMRQAAFNGDGVQYMKEMRTVMADIGDIQGKNVYQQKAISEALGMSTSEIIKMQTQQELYHMAEKDIGEMDRKMQEAKSKSVKQQMEDEMKAYSQEVGHSISEKEFAAVKLKQMENEQEIQSKINQLNGQFLSILSELGTIFLPLIIKSMEVLVYVMKVISSIFRNEIAKVIIEIVAGLLSISILIGNWSAIVTVVGSIATTVASVGLSLGPITAVIGFLITSLTTISEILLSIGTSLISAPVAIAAVVAIIGVGIYGIYKTIMNYWDTIISSFTNGDWIGGIIKLVDYVILGFFDEIISVGTEIIDWIAYSLGFNLDLTGWFRSEMDSIYKMISDIDLKSISTMIWNGIVWSFKNMPLVGILYNWLWGSADKAGILANSPSEFGLNIMEGILKSFEMMQDVLVKLITSPFTIASKIIESIFNIISNNTVFKTLSSMVGGIMLTTVGENSSTSQSDITKTITDFSKNVITEMSDLTKNVVSQIGELINEIKESSTNKNQDDITTIGSSSDGGSGGMLLIQTNSKLDSLVDRFDKLISSLESGKIVSTTPDINLSGTKVNDVLIRTNKLASQ
jgi:hypothetical protein